MKKIIITISLMLILIISLIIDNINSLDNYDINTDQLNNNAYELYKLEKQISIKQDKCIELEKNNESKIEEINTWKNKVENMKNNL